MAAVGMLILGIWIGRRSVHHEAVEEAAVKIEAAREQAVEATPPAAAPERPTAAAAAPSADRLEQFREALGEALSLIHI